jgi:hypothetical protein
MGYFRELPDAEIQSFLNDKRSSTDYILVKNLFRRVKLREDIHNIITIFDKYIIPEGARPDTVADQLYGSPELDWVVLINAGIINVRNDWPLSNRDLFNFCYEKYGSELNAVRFYETTEVKDSIGRLILPAGKIVDPTFNIQDPNNPGFMLNRPPIVSITNYEYETRVNDDKREIYVLKQSYLQQFLSDSRNLMLYNESSEYVNETLIRTENTRNTLP